ncbi:hypothetical protein [uncultured Desulfobacter sp.]|uniref:hypothetical protein n=1 Tax=uncultured Desulfobacter sp. TaxID=240139 RepID=UPI002AAACF12|nr:hypothetical protein [uncultured Desulfobacter sp.]
MWKLTVCCNVFVLLLFWLVSQVAIAPAHNLLVRYAETDAALPIFTYLAIRLRGWSQLVPWVWTALTLILAFRLKGRDEIIRKEWIMLHTSLSVFLGLVLLFFFGLAGILPVLKIGAVIP